MKKIFLMAAVALFAVTVADAQTKSRKKARSTESKLNSDIAKIKSEKAQAMEEQRLARLATDSMRRESEAMEEMQKDSMRMAWKEQRLAQVDSANQVKWTQQFLETDMAYSTARSQSAINRAAKLTDYQAQQASAINSMYNEKAKTIMLDSMLTEDVKQQQLTALNTERREKLKATIGKSKEKKLEKERIKYMAKNNDNTESAWLNQVASNN